MKNTSTHLARCEALLTEIFSELGQYIVTSQPESDSGQGEILVAAHPRGPKYCFSVTVRERITPQVADDLLGRIQSQPLPPETVRLVYAPVISPRVAEIALKYNVSHLDQAGNCHLANSAAGLLISRNGLRQDFALKERTTAGLFAPKASRIVRVMLQQPQRGWQVSELAAHPEVQVSAGLASKVKQSLVHQGYAEVRDRWLYLRHSLDLLQAWNLAYSGPAMERQYFLRGEVQQIEDRVAAWCRENAKRYALARFSAAWRLAAEVRYSVATLYVDSLVHREERLASFCNATGAKLVPSGANLVLLAPYDRSVFAGSVGELNRSTSPLQTYLDLQQMGGRAEEAAEAIFEKHLREPLKSVEVEKAGTT